MIDIPKVYLDSNVIIHMHDGRRPELKLEVLKAADSQRFRFPFTADTVSELALKIDSIDDVMQRLYFLTLLSREDYFERSALNFQFIRRDAFKVYDDLISVAVTPDLPAHFRSLVDFETHKGTASEYGMEPFRMNNFAPKKLFEYIDEKLSQYEYLPGSKDFGPGSVEQCMDLIESTYRENFEPFWRKSGLDPEEMMRGFKASTLFMLLDSFGYCRDQREAYEKGSAFADSAHTFLASHCKFLVSDDSRMRSRAKAVFWYLGQDTQVMTPDELLQFLKQG